MKKARLVATAWTAFFLWILKQASTSNINGAKLLGIETNKTVNRSCRETILNGGVSN